MTVDDERIRFEILDYIRESSLDRFDEEVFDQLFLNLAASQCLYNQVYNRFVQSLNLHAISHWRDVPPIPVQFFKEFELRSYNDRSTEHFWESSGTTKRKSRTFLASNDHYDTVIERLWSRYVPNFPGITFRLIPDSSEWPNSSLSHFFQRGEFKEFEVLSSSVNYSWKRGYSLEEGTFSIKFSSLLKQFAALTEDNIPVRLCGTSYAIASIFDYMEKSNSRFRLSEGSTIIDTGGYKGLVRERTRSEFLEQAKHYLDIPPHNCLNEYGMSELSSHFWSTYVEGEEWWSVPPWVRVRSVNPLTGEEVEQGAGVFYDLANVWSCCAVQTQDLIEVRNEGGVQYVKPLGRMKDAELKGCSITAEQSFR